MSSLQNRGRFVVFEGIDGCGKSTQAERLVNWLISQRIPAIVTREPGGTNIGQAIRSLLLETNEVIHPRTELLLFMADRAQHIDEVIKPALSKGDWVICDRFTDSTLAYQGYGKQISLQTIHALNAITVNYLKPDLTLWLKLDWQASLSRLNKLDRMERCGSEFYEWVSYGFQTLANQYPNNRTTIDASQPIDAVTSQVQRAVSPYLPYHSHQLDPLAIPADAQKS